MDVNIIARGKVMKVSLDKLGKSAAKVMQDLGTHGQLTVTFKGKPIAILQPLMPADEQATPSARFHPCFGMWSDRKDLQNLRQARCQLRIR